jgi:mRNA interferase MazF
MMSITTSDIVLVPFPFVDSNSVKRRPCLVLASYKPRALNQHCVLAMMTSQVAPPNFPFDVALDDYEKSGLPKPTLVRLSKIVTLDSKHVIRKIGSLTALDKESVNRQFAKLFKQLLS